MSDDEAAALDWAALRIVGPRGYDMGESLSMPNVKTIRITVRGHSRHDATANATGLYWQVRSLAVLPHVERPNISMVSCVLGVPRDVDEHIFEAQRLREEQRFELAVVEAQTHLEMHLRETLQGVAELHGKVVLALVRTQRIWSLRDEAGKQLFNVLLNRRPSDFARWSEYQLHVTRRNDAAHKGIRVEEHDAETSISVVVEFVRFIKKARDAAIEDLRAAPSTARP